MNFFRIISVVCLLTFFTTTTFSPSFASDNRDMISFNFVDVEIPTVIKFISEITGTNFLFDEKIKGKITIVAPTKLTIDESFSLFTSILSLKGYTIIPTGKKTYKIIPSSLAKQSGIISFDEKVPVNEGYITKLIPTEHIRAEETIKFLRPIVSRDGHISAFGPRNLLLIVDSAVNIEKVMSILKIIDLPAIQQEKARINVYFLENADAENLAKVLKVILKDLQTSYKSSARGKQKKPADPVPALSITPDKATNSLVIVASPSEYENILAVIKTLDRKRKQVFVEAMIIEASIDNLRALGTQWRAAVKDKHGDPVTIGGFGNISSGSMLSILSGLAGFSAGGMGNFIDVPVTSVNSSGSASTQTLTVPGFAALFAMNDFNNSVNVLSTPQILTSDNEEAEIVVGENVPFISGREQSASSANTVLSSIERKDVGITLRITPQVTEGNYVKLNIYQEISAVKETPESVFVEVGPTTTKRSTKTTVIVQDGHTVVIGGLMEEREEKEVSKVPLLGDIPLLGWLFKFENTSKKKTNLLVFLSPHIIKEPPQLSKITEEKHAEFVNREKFFKKGEILVKFKNDVSPDRALEILSEQDAEVIQHFDNADVYRIKIDSGDSVEEALEIFSSIEDVIYSEPNYRFTLEKNASGPEVYVNPQETAPVADTEENTGMAQKDFIEPLDTETPDNNTEEIKEPPALLLKASGDKPVKPTANNHLYSGEELLLKFNDTVSKAEAQEIISQKNAVVIKYFKGINVYHIKLKSDETVENAIADFSSVPNVLYVEPNYKVRIPKMPPAPEKEEINRPLTAFETDPAENSALQEDTGSDKVPTSHTSESVKSSDSNNMETPGPGKTDDINFFIQVGAWKHLDAAQDTMELLKSHYPETYIIEQNNFSKVRIPGIQNRAQGQLLLKEIKEKYNLNPLLVLESN